MTNRTRKVSVRKGVIATIPHLDRARFLVDLTDPVHIHQHALDITGEALRDDDFDLFVDFFALPHKIDTFAACTIIETREDLHRLFQNSRRQNEEAGVTHRERHCISATFKGHDLLLSSHLTRVMNGNYQLREAVPCHCVLQAIGGVWLATHSSYALEETDRPFDSLLTHRGKPLHPSTDTTP